jgi:hypothetical protein
MSKAGVKEEKGPPLGAGAAVEFPEDLKDAGWELKEHVGDGGQFKCTNKGLKLATSQYGSPFDAFGAARSLQAKHDKNSPSKPADETTEGPAPKGAVSRRFQMKLKVRLSAEGLQQKCIELDGVCGDKEQMESDFERVKDKFKEDLKGKQADVDALLHVVRHQYTEEEVECEERMVYEEKRVVVVRLDTDEAVESRAMKPEELQQRLVTL